MVVLLQTVEDLISSTEKSACIARSTAHDLIEVRTSRVTVRSKDQPTFIHTSSSKVFTTEFKVQFRLTRLRDGSILYSTETLLSKSLKLLKISSTSLSDSMSSKSIGAWSSWLLNADGLVIAVEELYADTCDIEK